jgi:hypothetical protein
MPYGVAQIFWNLIANKIDDGEGASKFFVTSLITETYVNYSSSYRIVLSKFFLYYYMNLNLIKKSFWRNNFIHRFTFEEAAGHIYLLLLKKDCYPRFIRSESYKSLLANALKPRNMKKP